ncbi:MAG: hypothetical protein Q7R56_01400 [Nanoarchaeota archaeon]|nr:hypothetical protein [Nanoarchaeota archaeon]
MKLTVMQKRLLDEFLVAQLKGLSVTAIIGEFNCVHSSVRNHLGPFQEWFGVDTDKDALKKIKDELKSDKIHVRYGVVSSHVDLPDNGCDVLLCPLLLHAQKDLGDVLQVLQAKVAFGGKVVIVDFSDAEKVIRSVDGEHYFHKEKGVELLLSKLRGFSKKPVADCFVAYEWVKV